MATKNNKLLIRRYYEELWNRWNYALIDKLIDPDIAFRGSLAVTVHGRNDFQQYMSTVRTAFPDFHNTIDELIAEGETVVARLSYRGTHEGDLFGVAATGHAITYSGVAIFQIRNRMIVEGWVMGDTAALMRQLGVNAAWPRAAR